MVTPFLPGDSLLFAAGTLAAMGALSLPLLVALLFTAAVLGDTLNYAVGACASFGPLRMRRKRQLALSRRISPRRPRQLAGRQGVHAAQPRV